MATATRERLIRTSHDLFYREGFHTVGLDRILDEVGVTKTTFYNHFESKDDLMLAVLDWHDEWWRGTFASRLGEHGGDDPRSRLAAVFDVLDELFEGGEYHGCMFINVAVEFPLPHDPAHQAAARHKQAMQDILRDLARAAGADDPEGFAEDLALLMEGAYVTQQVTRNRRTAEIGRRTAAMLLDKYLPAPAA